MILLENEPKTFESNAFFYGFGSIQFGLVNGFVLGRFGFEHPYQTHPSEIKKALFTTSQCSDQIPYPMKILKCPSYNLDFKI